MMPANGETWFKSGEISLPPNEVCGLGTIGVMVTLLVCAAVCEVELGAGVVIVLVLESAVLGVKRTRGDCVTLGALDKFAKVCDTGVGIAA